jgi:hypothetical protein
MQDFDGKYIRIVSANGRAGWRVDAKDPAVELGYIEWFSRWRKYIFAPLNETVYEQTCLREIAIFCEAATKEHRQRPAVAPAKEKT